MSILLFFDKRGFFYDRYLALFERWNEKEYDFEYIKLKNKILEINPFHLPHFLLFFEVY